MDSQTKYLLSKLEDKVLDVVSAYIKNNIPGDYGLVLSGGFDSGLLSAITNPKKIFRVSFEGHGTKFDESRYADAILKHIDFDGGYYELKITKEMFQDAFPKAVKVMGETTAHFSLIPLYLMMESLSKSNLKDFLSGEGPDEYLGGYARQIIFDELLKLYSIPELRNYHPTIHRVLGVKESQRISLMISYAQLLGYDLDKLKKWLDENPQVNNYPFQGIIGKMDMDMGTIEVMEQKLAKHFGINFHYPYINEEFADFCYSLPDDLKIRDGVSKWGFRQICKKYLPEMMWDRAKMGGPVAPVNELMGWDLPEFDKSRYIEEQKKILGEK